MHATRILTVALMLALMAGAASAAVTINEMKVKGTEFVELYNSGGDIDVSGWTLDDGSGPEGLTGVIPAGGFMNVATTLPLSNSGGVVELRDAAGALVDDVGYGNRGGAPLGFNSIGRSPDGDDTDDWARDFEYLDDTVNANGETPGASNVHNSPNLGSTVLINELDPFGTGDPDGFDRVEIYNPLGVAANIQGFYISDGDGYCQVTNAINIPAGGYVVLTEDVVGEGMDCTGFDDIEFSGADVAYIYDANATRVDQLGYMNGPQVDPGSTFQRCGDGMGPNDGYDYASSGGDTSLQVLGQTLGGTNSNCATPVEPASWGQIKAVYR